MHNIFYKIYFYNSNSPHLGAPRGQQLRPHQPHRPGGPHHQHVLPVEQGGAAIGSWATETIFL